MQRQNWIRKARRLGKRQSRALNLAHYMKICLSMIKTRANESTFRLHYICERWKRGEGGRVKNTDPVRIVRMTTFTIVWRGPLTADIESNHMDFSSPRYISKQYAIGVAFFFCDACLYLVSFLLSGVVSSFQLFCHLCFRCCLYSAEIVLILSVIYAFTVASTLLKFFPPIRFCPYLIASFPFPPLSFDRGMSRQMYFVHSPVFAGTFGTAKPSLDRPPAAVSRTLTRAAPADAGGHMRSPGVSTGAPSQCGLSGRTASAPCESIPLSMSGYFVVAAGS